MTKLTCRYKAQRNSVRCSALSGLVVMFQSYDHFSSSVSLLEIPDRFSSLTQRVTPIDNRDDFARLKKLFDKEQILFIDVRYSH